VILFGGGKIGKAEFSVYSRQVSVPPPEKNFHFFQIVVCIVVPHYRSFLTEDEIASWKQLDRLLGHIPKIILLPESLKNSGLFSGSKKIYFPDSFFEYPYGYNRLLLRGDLYNLLKEFEYILIYQLDCLVFRNDLLDWCRKEFDYIGSPWFMDENKKPTNIPFSVGNGGFSLRKVSTALEVLSTPVRRGSLFPMPHCRAPQPTGLKWFFWNCVRRYRQHAGLWCVEDELENYFENEDVFWSFIAPQINRRYKVAPLEAALSFGMELNPRLCVQMNGGQIPFGCHAWWKHDRAYVESILMSLPETRSILESHPC
jgi:hypothetical protein